jgi:hypothetical protein
MKARDRGRNKKRKEDRDRRSFGLLDSVGYNWLRMYRDQ